VNVPDFEIEARGRVIFHGAQLESTVLAMLSDAAFGPDHSEKAEIILAGMPVSQALERLASIAELLDTGRDPDLLRDVRTWVTRAKAAIAQRNLVVHGQVVLEFDSESRELLPKILRVGAAKKHQRRVDFEDGYVSDAVELLQDVVIDGYALQRRITEAVLPPAGR
jgi:hypothetical protein